MSTPSAPWDRIYNDTKMHIPGLTDAVFKQMLYHVLNDFTYHTNVWTEEVPIPVVPSTLTYAFNVSKKGMPNRLLLLYDPAMADPDRKWVQSGVQMSKPGVITLSYAPSTGTTWNAVIAKTLNTVDTENYPEFAAEDQWIIDKYGDGVLYGVLGRLMTMPAKPFTNLKLGGMNWQTYVTERGRARTDALKANVFGGQRWMFPQSFATTMRKGWA